MSETLTIKRESLPVRCEVCHQTDLFNPETGECRRCSPIMRRRSGADVFELFKIPNEFREALFTAAGNEGIWWVGFPVKWYARQVYAPVWLFLIPGLLFLIAAFVSNPLFWLGVVVCGMLALLVWGHAKGGKERLDSTMYILTETRALVVRADFPGDWMEFRLGRWAPRLRMLNEGPNVGHLNFHEVNRNSGESGFLPEWKKPRNAGVIAAPDERGFFYIENPRLVEWIVRHRILGDSSFGPVESDSPEDGDGTT